MSAHLLSRSVQPSHGTWSVTWFRVGGEQDEILCGLSHSHPRDQNQSPLRRCSTSSFLSQKQVESEPLPVLFSWGTLRLAAELWGVGWAWEWQGLDGPCSLHTVAMAPWKPRPCSPPCEGNQPEPDSGGHQPWPCTPAILLQLPLPSLRRGLTEAESQNILRPLVIPADAGGLLLPLHPDNKPWQNQT